MPRLRKRQHFRYVGTNRPSNVGYSFVSCYLVRVRLGTRSGGGARWCSLRIMALVLEFEYLEQRNVIYLVHDHRWPTCTTMESRLRCGW